MRDASSMLVVRAGERLRAHAARAGMRQWALLAALAALFAVRVWVACTLRVNSDEPQHLHVVWAWTQGLLPYRDLFDNHAPLFHVLYAPLLALFGERADIVPLMRLAVIPWYALAVWLTWRIGCALYDRRVALFAAALAALQPTLFARSAEFRPDDAWAVAWLAAAWIAMAGPWTRRRAFDAGLAVGLAAALSIKTALLVAAAAAAFAVLACARALRGDRFRWPEVAGNAATLVSGAVLLPLVVAGAFAAAGGWDALVHCLVVHNAPPGLGRWAHAGATRWIFPLAVVLLAAVASSALRRSRDARTTRRLMLAGSAVLYIALRASYQPLLDKQDLLPVVPLLALPVAAFLLRPRRPVARIALACVALGIEAALALSATRPWRDEAASYTAELRTLLRLSRPGEPVMDDKGEAIFRPRPYYWVLENVTLYRLANGSIADDIAQRLVNQRVGVGVFEREPSRDSAFVRENYVAVAPHVDVAGQMLGHGQAGEPIAFEITLADRYAIVADTPGPIGTLDGSPFTAPRLLDAGWHEFVPQRGAAFAVEAARAAQLGYRPFGDENR